MLAFAEPRGRCAPLPCRWQARALGCGLEAPPCSGAGLGGAAGQGGGAGPRQGGCFSHTIQGHAASILHVSFLPKTFLWDKALCLGTKSRDLTKSHW